jgi:thioredoxin 1
MYWPSILSNPLLHRPTFIFLKGSTKVDQLKGASKPCVSPGSLSSFFLDLLDLETHSGLESAVQKHAASSSTSTAFSGKGNTLGSPAAPDVVGDGKQTLQKVFAWFTQLDPQLRVLLGLIGLYLLFWSFR